MSMVLKAYKFTQPVGILKVYRAEKYDPTRTTSLRNAFANEMKRRFSVLQRKIKVVIVDLDVFGIKGQATNESSLQAFKMSLYVQPRAFTFTRNSDKVEAFMNWLQEQINNDILQVGQAQQWGVAIEEPWTNLYLQDSYKRGVQRARYEMGKAGYNVPNLTESGGIDSVMATPFHLDRAGVVYSRVFSELKGITSQMDTQISRVLAQGLLDGDGPALLARKLNQTIGGGDLSMSDSLGRFIPAKRRATILARTEVIRGHHRGMVQEYENWALEGVTIKAEFATVEDGQVCSVCASLHGKEFSLKDVKNLIPVHPQCRCIALPLDVTPVKKKKTGGGVDWNDASQYDWEESDTVDSLLDQLQTKYNVRSDMTKRQVSKFGNSEIVRLNVIGRELSHMYKNNPTLAKMVMKKGYSGGVLFEIGSTFNNVNTLAQYNTRTRLISMGNKPLVRSTPTLNIGTAHNVSNDYAGSFRHEFGHYVHLSIMKFDTKKPWRDFCMDALKKNPSFFDRKISVYASTDQYEAFAEAFCAYTSPLYKKGDLPENIEKLVESMITKRIDL